MACNPLARAWQDLMDTLREGENLAELPTALKALNQELGGRSAAEGLSDEEVARAVERLRELVRSRGR